MKPEFTPDEVDKIMMSLGKYPVKVIYMDMPIYLGAYQEERIAKTVKDHCESVMGMYRESLSYGCMYDLLQAEASFALRGVDL